MSIVNLSRVSLVSRVSRKKIMFENFSDFRTSTRMHKILEASIILMRQMRQVRHFIKRYISLLVQTSQAVSLLSHDFLAMRHLRP